MSRHWRLKSPTSGRSTARTPQSLFLLGVFLLGCISSCSFTPQPAHSQDSAMLLMISSYTVLLSGEEVAWSGRSAGGRMLSLRPQVDAASASEVDALIRIYSDLYSTNVEKVYEMYPDRADQLVSRLEKELQEKVDNLLAQKQRLQARRRRRRWGLFRRIGRGLARVARFLGRTAKTIIIDSARNLAKNAIDEIKGRVREIFEGRVNTLIARIASKFGPLAPFVGNKMKRVLDRWWIRTRDRITGRLARQQSATQTAQAKAERQPEPPGNSDDSVAELENETLDSLLGMDEDCGTDTSWVDNYWQKTVLPALKEDRKNCSNTAGYYNCLKEKAAQGICAADVHEACEQIYEGIWALPEGSVSIDVSNIFVNDLLWPSADFSMTFNAGGGSVNGSHMHTRVFDEEDPACTTTYTTTFSGNFDPSTCILQGSGQWTLSLSDTSEGGACWYHGCDFGHQGCTRSYGWALELKDGEFVCVTDLSEGEICNLRISMNTGK